jgi:AcrR family transcriptional regulator
MPRKPDPLLQSRILEAARRLYAKGGEHSLSMRSLAKAARTNTPAVYRRFRNRKNILAGLLTAYQEELTAVLKPCRSVQEAAGRVLEFTLARPNEYRLVFHHLFAQAKKPRPNVELMKARCAEWYGGSPADYTSLVLAIWSLMNGTALLLISKAVPEEGAEELRRTFSASVEILVENAEDLRRIPLRPAEVETTFAQ